ncbi:PREDICTED: protein SIEVE ELEMENT OCCLUSION B-like [Ipomoea nil]|uniref:protein SIEVE ELEMENT OCCLUSION B-like n=1 Tax=Ipomoea nil TaxID=35883 RepID=UPI0009013DC7|nr:PREDICTED: protein SIEVE ELEMENT OCCLUSION B-like [Ipomoea nil]
MQSHLREILEFGLMVRDPHERITPQFIRFVKEKSFPAFLSGGNPIVISLDNCGKLVHTNALHMILTWRDDLAFSRVFVRRGYNIIPLLEKGLTEITLGVDTAIVDIKERISNLVEDINQKIHDWRNNINERIEDSDSSYNYTNKKEKEFWDEETYWNLEVLVRKTRQWSEFDIDNKITYWIKKRNDIFLCGGNDSKCAQEFATKVKEVNFKTQLDIKFTYIGKNMKVMSLIGSISDYVFSSNEEYFWFWTRLQSAFVSRMNYYLNKTGRDDGDDKIVRGLQKLLAYEANGTSVGGWVLLSKGEEVVLCDFGDKMLKVISGIQEWKSNVYNDGFSQAFKDYYENHASSSQGYHAYCALEYPYTLDKIPEDVNCPQCSYNMHKYVTFTCCHDHDIWN